MTEKRTVCKCFFAWDFEREERWLNEMAMEGWALVHVGLCRYTFERSQTEEYVVRMEMHSSDEQYLAFMNEIGAEYIGRVAQWIYFRRKAELGQFDLYSDIDSKTAHLGRIGKLLAVVGFANLGIGMANLLNPISIGWINLLCATLVMYALGRIHGKKEALEKERRLHD